jgi:DNA topoisomerase-3
MNFSRLFSVLYNAQLRVGRVQTPTLAIIVEREQKIAEFVKEPFYVVEASCGDLKTESEKIKYKAKAESIATDCNGKAAEVKSVERKKKSESAPNLYDLSMLQREANRLFGYTAMHTLSAVQNLYEQKVVTYPRTNSRFITEDMADGISALVVDVADVLPFSTGNLSINLEQVVNSAKVTDHHAIIPTPSMPKTDIGTLPTAERNILMMICTRLISAVSDKHTFDEIVITLDCNSEAFRTKGKIVIKNGWKSIEQSFLSSIGKPRKDEDKPLPELSEGERLTITTSIREGFTNPPKHFTEDLLLSAMETAGAKDMPENSIPHTMPKGLGTPATRAAIIENLIKSGLLSRKDKMLLPSEKGVNLIKILPDTIKSPMLTTKWEHDLKRIEDNDFTSDEFMTAINRFVADTVKTHKDVPAELKALFSSSRLHNGRASKSICKCPRCGSDVAEYPKGFFCSNKTCKFAIFKESKYFTSKRLTLNEEIITALLTEGRIYLKGLYSEKSGKTYNATIILDDKGEGYPSFKMEFDKKGAKNG